MSIHVVKKIYRSTTHAIRGIASAFTGDESFRLEIFLGIAIYAGITVLLWPMTGSEMVVLLASYFLILITELVNTSIEVLLARLHPIRHHLIGTSKDIAAAAVFVAFVFAGIVIVILTLGRVGIIIW